MKQLIAGIVILLVIGIGAFLYRNALEHPAASVSSGQQASACPTDAKLCPDGTSVTRSGASCSFAPCAFPNVELAAIHIAYVVPAAYMPNDAALGQDATLMAAYEKAAASSTDAIIVRDYPIPAGKTATSTMLANTVYESSGAQAKSLAEFKPKIINGMAFRCVTLERFEGQVHTACYLARQNDVLRFEVLEKGIDWTDPKLDIDALPEHQAFYGMLSTLMLEG